jgi:hypothetical protein
MCSNITLAGFYCRMLPLMLSSLRVEQLKRSTVYWQSFICIVSRSKAHDEGDVAADAEFASCQAIGAYRKFEF